MKLRKLLSKSFGIQKTVNHTTDKSQKIAFLFTFAKKDINVLHLQFFLRNWRVEDKFLILEFHVISMSSFAKKTKLTS